VRSRQLGLVHPLTGHVRAAFGHDSRLRSTWTFFGVAGFLVWGIPMAMTIAGIFAKAWRREPFGWGGKLWRGAVWFALYLTMIGVRERIAFGGVHHGSVRLVFFALPLIPVFLFWTATPALLAGWDDFGPIGVAMALLTWCGVSGTGWVATACVGAVLWERAAPATTVIEAEIR